MKGISNQMTIIIMKVEMVSKGWAMKNIADYRSETIK